MGEEDKTLASGPYTAPTLREEAIVDVPPHEFLTGARYELGSRLGEGRMGEILSCTDAELGREIAAKRLRKVHSSETVSVETRAPSEVMARFLRESRVQAQLEHPGIVPVYDMLEDEDGRPFFTMQKITGVTLDSIIGGAEQDGGLHRLLSSFAQVCLTIEYAHSRGVIHRDLRPANILFGQFGEVYVVDWGVAKITAAASSQTQAADLEDALTAAGTTIGTPGYMAPEQALGLPVDARTDVFALGLILYEMLTRQRLVVDPMKRDYDARPSRIVPSAPPELDKICVKATAYDPDERYPSARALHEDIESFLAGARDVDLREKLALEHLDRAKRLIALSESDSDMSNRAEALREISRAIALAPSNKEALRAFVRLFELPKETPVPRAIRAEAKAIQVKRFRRTMRGSVPTVTLPWVTVYPVIAYFAGVRNVPVAASIGVLWCIATLSIVWASRSFERRRTLPLVALMFAIMSTSLFAGPLFIVPVLDAISIMPMIVMWPSYDRRMMVVVASLPILVPTVLNMLGLDPTYTVHGSTLTFHGLLRASIVSDGLVLSLVHVIAIMLGSRVVARFRDALDTLQWRSMMQQWQLEQLVPREPTKKETQDP